MIEVYTPGWRFADQPRSTAGNISTDAPLHVALVANGKPNGEELLEALAQQLAGTLSVVETRSWRKPSVSVPPTAEQFAEITAWADVALVAIGD